MLAVLLDGEFADTVYRVAVGFGHDVAIVDNRGKLYMVMTGKFDVSVMQQYVIRNALAANDLKAA